MSRFGRVALIGRSNVGKSTLLNAALDVPLAIVSPLPQTTRTSLLGVVNRDDAQIAFLDTPGIHRPKTELGRRMNAAALDAIRQADVRVFVTDVVSSFPEKEGKTSRRAPGPMPAREDIDLFSQFQSDTPSLLLINKVDLLPNKQLLLPLIAEWKNRGSFGDIVPVSCLSKPDVERVLSAIVSALPVATPAYAPDELTDRPMRYFAAEYVREQVLLSMRKEVPHAVAVSVDEYHESPNLVSIAVTLHVEKDGQRRILVGRGGSSVRDIGTRARVRIAELLKKKVHLELFIKTNPRWKSVPRQLAELGYDGPASEATSPSTKGTA